MAYRQENHPWAEISVLYRTPHGPNKIKNIAAQTKRNEIHFQLAHQCLPGITGLVSRIGHLAPFSKEREMMNNLVINSGYGTINQIRPRYTKMK